MPPASPPSVLGLGLTHYPPLSGPDEQMAEVLERTLRDTSIPEEHRSAASWPEAMRSEWGGDRGATSATVHRNALVAAFRRLRSTLDAFEPDVIIVVGDDQYENFREDIIPPYAVLAYDDMSVHPWRHAQASSDMTGKPNIWEEGPDTCRVVRGAPDVARAVATGLLERGFDAAYAYRPLHHPGLAHAFLNTILYLDWDRQGFDVPVIPLAVNCYGSAVISRRGFLAPFADSTQPDPPAPTPQRMFALGAALADTVTSLGVRVAVIASSSWSHAFLCDATWRVRPDVGADRRLYERMTRSDYGSIEHMTSAELVEAGQHEVLNWFVLWGLVDRLGLELQWSTFVETHVFNSNKVFAEYLT